MSDEDKLREEAARRIERRRKGGQQQHCQCCGAGTFWSEPEPV